MIMFWKKYKSLKNKIKLTYEHHAKPFCYHISEKAKFIIIFMFQFKVSAFFLLLE